MGRMMAWDVCNDLTLINALLIFCSVLSWCLLPYLYVCAIWFPPCSLILPFPTCPCSFHCPHWPINLSANNAPFWLRAVICPAWLVASLLGWLCVMIGPVHPSMAFLLTGITSVEGFTEIQGENVNGDDLHNPRRKCSSCHFLGVTLDCCFSPLVHDQKGSTTAAVTSLSCIFLVTVPNIHFYSDESWKAGPTSFPSTQDLDARISAESQGLL